MMPQQRRRGTRNPSETAGHRPRTSAWQASAALDRTTRARPARHRRRRTEMPSLIPGMDPFLEDPAVFPDLHDNLIAELRNAINAQLPPPYYASSASRVWVEPSQRRVEPDVIVPRPERPGSGPVEVPPVAMAVARPPVVVRIPREEY